MIPGILWISTYATIDGVASPLPDRTESRKLVVSLAMFWAFWGIGVVSTYGVPVLVGICFVVAIVFGVRLSVTLYGIEGREIGQPGWRIMFVPSFRNGRVRWRAMSNMFNPPWIRHTLRETGWNPVVVGLGLLSLLIVDLVLLVLVLPHWQSP
jgi:hypothetical protein